MVVSTELITYTGILDKKIQWINIDGIGFYRVDYPIQVY